MRKRVPTADPRHYPSDCPTCQTVPWKLWTFSRGHKSNLQSSASISSVKRNESNVMQSLILPTCWARSTTALQTWPMHQMRERRRFYRHTLVLSDSRRAAARRIYYMRSINRHPSLQTSQCCHSFDYFSIAAARSVGSVESPFVFHAII
jgi:hypothetical protein